MSVQTVFKAMAREVAKRVLDNETVINSSNGSLFDFSLSLCSNPVDPGGQKCKELQSIENYLVFIYIILAFIAFVGIQFMQKRVALCSTCLWGRPGIWIPVDLLHHSRYRLIYVTIFGSMSSVFYKIVTQGGPPIININVSDNYAENILSILETLLYIMILCTMYYPLFACVDTPVPIVGHLIGTFFATFLLGITIFREYNFYSGCLNGCKMSNNLPFVVMFFSVTPVALIEFFLVLWFLGNIGYDIHVMITSSKFLQPSSKYINLDDHIERVKYCLRRDVEDLSQTVETTRLKRFLHAIYPYDPGFKFPLRFLAGMVIAIVIIYQMSSSAIGALIIFTIALNEISMRLVEILDDVRIFVNDAETDDLELALNSLGSIARITGYAGFVIGSFLIVAVIIATIFCAVQFYLTFRNVSQHFHQSIRGDLSFLPSNEYPSLHKSILSSLEYPGYLIAYSVWAWVVYTGLVILAEIVLLTGLAILVLLIDFLAPKIIVAIIGLLWTQAIYWSQFILIKLVFLQNAYPDSEHQVLNNRRLMHWFTYFCIFQNAFVGLFSAVSRIIKSFALNLLTFSRLDKVLLMKGFESFDSGNETYISMIYLNYTQNNSVMNVFCHLLLEQIKLKKIQDAGEIIDQEQQGEIIDQEQQCYCNRTMSIELVNLADKRDRDNDTSKDPPRPYVSQRAYNRWRVAYTLIRNEELIELTGTNLKKKKQTLRERLVGDINESYSVDEDGDNAVELNISA